MEAWLLAALALGGVAAVSLFSSDDDDGSDSSTEGPEQPTDNSATYTGNEESELDHSYDPATGQIRFEDASGEYELVDDGEFVASQFEPVDPPAALVQVSGSDGQDDMIVTGMTSSSMTATARIWLTPAAWKAGSSS